MIIWYFNFKQVTENSINITQSNSNTQVNYNLKANLKLNINFKL